MMIDNVPHQEFAEHFMVQVWREGRQVWEDYRDAQVCIMIIIILIIMIFIIVILIRVAKSDLNSTDAYFATKN